MSQFPFVNIIGVLLVNNAFKPHAVAVGTSAILAVERKHARLYFRIADTAGWAGKGFTEWDVPVFINKIYYYSIGIFQRGINGMLDLPLYARLYDKAVDDDLDSVQLLLFQCNVLGKLHHLFVYSCPHE